MVPLFMFPGFALYFSSDALDSDTNSWALYLPLFPIVMLGGACLYSSNKVAKLDREIKPLEEELRKVETNIAEVKEKCSKKLGEILKEEQSRLENALKSHT